jgi:beta-glucosidase
VGPPRALAAFTRVELGPGESRRVTLQIDRHAFSYWSAERHSWLPAPGRSAVMMESATDAAIKR